MYQIDNKSLNHKNQQLYQTKYTPINNWKHQDNHLRSNVSKSPFEPLYQYGHGYTAGKNSQSITAGAGTTPLLGGMREDGRLISFQGTTHNLNSHTDIGNKNYMMSSQAHNNSGGVVWRGTLQHTYSNSDWKNNLYKTHLSEGFENKDDIFNSYTSGIPSRSWSNSYNGSNIVPVQSDDSSTPLEAGQADISNDENEGNNASVPTYQNNGNNSYNVLTNPHPSDEIGSVINMLSNLAKEKMSKNGEKDTSIVTSTSKTNNKTSTVGGDSETFSPNGTFEREIEMIENINDRCIDPSYPYYKTSQSFPGQYCSKQDISFDQSVENKEFCYIKDKTVPKTLSSYYDTSGIKECQPSQQSSHSSQKESISNKTKARITMTDDKRKYYDSNINEDKRKYQTEQTWDRNQLMVDNNRTPININMSCNQGGRRGDVDEYGYYSGYGTPNLYNQCVYNNKGCYGDTLNNWYGDMSDSNNVYRRRKRWADRDYYREGYGQPNFSTTQPLSMSNDEISRTVIGAPYSMYTPYAEAGKNISDNARDTFNVTNVPQN